MKKITISMDDWMHTQVQANKGTNCSAYIRSLIVKDLGINNKIK